MSAVPRASDAVERWFDPLLAKRLAQAGMGTLGALTERINEAGARWWYPVRGMGVTRAARVVQWLQAQPGALGLLAADGARGTAPGPEHAGQAGPQPPLPRGSEPAHWVRQLCALQPVEH